MKQSKQLESKEVSIDVQIAELQYQIDIESSIILPLLSGHLEKYKLLVSLQRDYTLPSLGGLFCVKPATKPRPKKRTKKGGKHD